MSELKPAKSKARGRPAMSDEEIAEKRRHIAACALRLFQAEGYPAVSMRRLAAEANCTVMTLYKYFDRKIDVLRHLWADVFSDLFDQLDEIASQEEAAIRRLQAVALGYVSYWLEHREHYFLVFMSGDVSQSDVSVFVEDGASIDRFSLIYMCLAEAVGDDTDPTLLNLKAQSLLCALNGISHNLVTISGFPWLDPQELVETAVLGVLKA
ncbi:MAG: TetR/AcrR family transcriptional regulator [Pseudomonadota bacterium]